MRSPTSRTEYPPAVAASERFLPQADETASAEVLVAADAARTYGAIGSTDVSSVRLGGVLSSFDDARAKVGADASAPRTLDRLLAAGNGPVELAAEPGVRRAIGVAGRYHFDRQMAHLTADEFAAYHEPGSLKGVVEFTLSPEGYGTRLRCDVRVQATDDDTRSTLTTAWFAVGMALRMLLPRLLDAIRAEAEGSGAQSAEQGDADGDHGDAGDLRPA